MIFHYNSLGQLQQPRVAICKLDLTMLGYLNATNIVMNLTFNNLSETTFVCYKGSNHYDSIRKDMVIEVISGNTIQDDSYNLGRFVITNVEEESDGQTTKKSVTAQSYEVTMNRVTLSYKENTVFKLWDLVNPDKGIQLKENGTIITSEDGTTQTIYNEYPTLLYIIQQQTGWTMGSIDSDLLNEWRTMTIDKEQAYGLLMGDIAEAFKCYFTFDTLEKKFYCHSRDEEKNPPQNTGINISFRNLIKTQKISEGSEDIITALTVEGAEGVGINLVNPLGNNVIYDFSYYMNDEEWGMPQSLQTKVQAWLDKIDDKTETYIGYVKRIREYNVELVELDGKLQTEKATLTSLQDVQSVKIAAGDNNGLKENHDKIVAQEAVIAKIQSDINTTKGKITYYGNLREGIISLLSFEKNFTSAELKTLQYYINGSVYENENFVYTSVMSEADKIDISNQLYTQGLKAMAKLSRNLYQYDCDIAPFMLNPEYIEFSKNIKFGGLVNLEIEEGKWVQPKLMQINIDFDNPENSKAVLSDSFRLLNSVYEFSDGYTQAIKASRKTSLSASKWDEPNDNGFFSTVGDYISNALNLARQEIINADNQEFTLGSYGLRGKKLIDSENGTYDDCQVAMTNNVLAFTDDNWTSCKTALGKIKIGETGSEIEKYGLVAEAVYGNLVAGEQLVITDNKDGNLATFRMDASGVRLTNAPMTIEKGNTKIILDPSEDITNGCFKIQKKDGTTWKDVLYETDEGGIVAESINVKSGKIGGWTIDENGLSSPTGDYIKTNGTGKLSLLTYDNGSAWFNGNIYANNLMSNNSGSGQNIFVNGTMLGSWLTDDSVGTSKLDKVWVNEINGVVADFKEIHASIITTDILSAGFIESGGVDTPLLFGGHFYMGSKENPYNHADIYGRVEDISSIVKQQYSLYLETAGNIHLNTYEEASVIVDHRLSSDKIQCNELLVTCGNENQYFECKGNTKTKWFECTDNATIKRLHVSNGSSKSFSNDVCFQADGLGSFENLNVDDKIQCQNIESYNNMKTKYLEVTENIRVNTYDWGYTGYAQYSDHKRLHIVRGIIVGNEDC